MFGGESRLWETEREEEERLLVLWVNLAENSSGRDNAASVRVLKKNYHQLTFRSPCH